MEHLIAQWCIETFILVYTAYPSGKPDEEYHKVTTPLLLWRFIYVCAPYLCAMWETLPRKHGANLHTA